MKNSSKPTSAASAHRDAWPVRVVRFYVEGFRAMTWGRTLWIIIILKLCVMFLVLRLFFFKPALAGQTEEQKQETVSRNLISPR